MLRNLDDLTPGDYEHMLDLSAVLLDNRDLELAWQLVTAKLNDYLHGRLCLFVDNLRWEQGTGQVKTWAPYWPGRLPWGELLRQNLGAHPLIYYYATHDDRTPLAISDVTDEATWHRTSTYRVMSSFFGVDHQLALPLRAPAGVIRSFLICRPIGEEVADRDRTYARRIQPLLVRIDSHLRELQQLRDSTPVSSAAGLAEERAAAFAITPRELMVLGLLATGMPAATIARRLGISVHTVAKHQENLYRKLGTTDRLTTVLRAQEVGLVTAPTLRLPEMSSMQIRPHGGIR
jgi:DNA-binding CsgD family transcriptional regulator